MLNRLVDQADSKNDQKRSDEPMRRRKPVTVGQENEPAEHSKLDEMSQLDEPGARIGRGQESGGESGENGESSERRQSLLPRSEALRHRDGDKKDGAQPEAEGDDAFEAPSWGISEPIPNHGQERAENPNGDCPRRGKPPGGRRGQAAWAGRRITSNRHASEP